PASLAWLAATCTGPAGGGARATARLPAARSAAGRADEQRSPGSGAWPVVGAGAGGADRTGNRGAGGLRERPVERPRRLSPAADQAQVNCTGSVFSRGRDGRQLGHTAGGPCGVGRRCDWYARRGGLGEGTRLRW